MLRRIGLVVLLGLITSMVGLAPARAAGIATKDLSSGSSGGETPASLAQFLAGSGVTVSEVHYTGDEQAAGTFTGGGAPIGFESGVILSSGNIADVTGPNSDDGVTTGFGTAGDDDLDELAGYETYDAAALEFDFVADSSTVHLRYVFSSDEYNEFVDSEFNDVFAFFVNGENCAIVPGSGEPVSVNTINNGNPYGSTANASHPELYRNNERDEDGNAPIDTEMDGLTRILDCVADVTPGVTNTFRLVVADTSDEILDTNVFIARGSLTTCPEDGLAVLDGTPAAGTVSGIIHGVVEPLLGTGDGSLGPLVHDVNCDVVVPTEDAVDAALA